jgi:hypothetical protein
VTAPASAAKRAQEDEVVMGPRLAMMRAASGAFTRRTVGADETAKPP